jgi:hypothetical protein
MSPMYLLSLSKIMNIFYGSFINHNKELILIPKTNLYFYLGDVNTVDEVKYKLLEWCSRSCFKAMPYRYTKKNREYQDDVLRKVNECLDMEFTREQMELIYTKLGNCINHELTMKFVSSGYDMKLLEESKMLNTINQKLEFHSVSGLMCKSHPKSIICKTPKNPFLLDVDNPRKYGGDREDVVVLQVMILEGGFLVEYVPKDVYEESLNE